MWYIKHKRYASTYLANQTASNILSKGYYITHLLSAAKKTDKYSTIENTFKALKERIDALIELHRTMNAVTPLSADEAWEIVYIPERKDKQLPEWF